MLYPSSFHVCVCVCVVALSVSATKIPVNKIVNERRLKVPGIRSNKMCSVFAHNQLERVIRTPSQNQ